MKSLSEALGDISSTLKDLGELLNSLKEKERIHRNNEFNRRLSSVLHAFSDIETIAGRLERDIDEFETLNKEIELMHATGSDKVDSSEVQRLTRLASELSKSIHTDFKALYAFGKIFLDKYTFLMLFLFRWRGVGGQSVTNFFNDLKKYTGKDLQVASFKEACLDALNAVDIFITQYRDDYIVHDQTSHKDTRWFIHNLDGTVRILGQRPSITPQQLLFVISSLVEKTAAFIKKNAQFLN